MRFGQRNSTRLEPVGEIQGEAAMDRKNDLARSTMSVSPSVGTRRHSVHVEQSFDMKRKR